MNALFVTEAYIRDLIANIKKQALYGPIVRNGNPVLVRADKIEPEKLILDNNRLPSSFRGVIFPQKEKLAEYGESANPTDIPTYEHPIVLLGLKNCDLQALEILDEIFIEGDYTDPFYERRRNALFIISSDCVELPEKCFGNMVGIEPFPTSGFDLNLSPVQGGFVLEIGSEKGEQAIKSFEEQPPKATEEQLRERDEQREKAKEILKQRNGEKSVTDIPFEELEERVDAVDLMKWVSQCVECAACTNICPTCQCFYMYDQVVDEDRFERIRAWDSCLLADYPRMAGAGDHKMSTRPHMKTRFHNRIAHKYSYIPKNENLIGCTGCGRCIEACLGKIDLREIVHEVL